jgi:hypothetical protein
VQPSRVFLSAIRFATLAPQAIGDRDTHPIFRVVSRLRAHEPALQNPLNYRLMVVSKGVSIF